MRVTVRECMCACACPHINTQVLEQHDRCGGGSHTYEMGPNGRYVFDSGLHYTVPESALLLQLCTGTRQVPVPVDLMGEPADANGGVTYDRVFMQGDEDKPFGFQLYQKHLPELYRRFPDCKAEIDLWQQGIRHMHTMRRSLLLPYFHSLAPFPLRCGLIVHASILIVCLFCCQVSQLSARVNADESIVLNGFDVSFLLFTLCLHVRGCRCIGW
jgi:hypothetical protein